MTAALKDDLALAAEFPAATREQWLALVDTALKGAPFENKLVNKTYDGLRIDPLYARRSDASALAGREPGTPWQIMARVDHPDPAVANKLALEDLEGGATGLALVFAGAPAARGFGVAIDGLADIERALADVRIELIALRIETAIFEGRFVAALLSAFIEQRKLDPGSLAIDFGLDPVGDTARSGTQSAPFPVLCTRAATVTRDLLARGFSTSRMLRADGRVIHDAGGSEAQELAFVLATGVTYLRFLEAGGLALDEARRRLSFILSADADQFLTMAKFRALRKLWARVEEACGLPPAPAFIAAETAWRMMTKRDAYVNMLRTTIAAFAAGLGGANAITALPFTNALGLPDAFARRVARNTQLILEEESNLSKVSDPAAGAGGIEALTDELCRAAWTSFQEIEAAGGIAAALADGSIQTKVAATRAAREGAIATRRDPLTGTSEFPHIHEANVAVLDAAAPARKHGTAPIPEKLADIAKAFASGSKVSDFAPFDLKPAGTALAPMRLAEPYEALRDASDAALKKTGSRPKVFLANLGKPVDFIARAMFAKNFFAAGGVEAVEFSSSPPPEKGRSSRRSPQGEGGRVGVDANNDPSPALRADPPLSGEGETEIEALVAAFKQSGAKVVCLCSSDEVYADQAAPAAQALAAAGAAHIYLAGRPGKNEAALTGAGIMTFIYAGCDVLRTLCTAHDSLGLR